MTLTNQQKQHTNIHIFLTIIALSILLGWIVPSHLESRHYPLSVHRDQVATLGRVVNESVSEYRYLYQTFPDFTEIALLSDKATSLLDSVRDFKSPTSKDLTGGLYNMSMILDEFLQKLIDLRPYIDNGIYWMSTYTKFENRTGTTKTSTFHEYVSEVRKIIDDLADVFTDIDVVLSEMQSVAASTRDLLQNEREFLKDDRVGIQSRRYYTRYLYMVLLRVTPHRTNGHWKYNVLDDCDVMTNKVLTIGYFSKNVTDGLNSILQKLISL